MSINITTAFVQQYRANVFHLSQQKGSQLRPGVRVESQKGKSAFYDRIGSVAAQLRTSRHSDTPILDTPHSRRMVTLADYEWGDMVDNQDKVRMLIDPTSDYAMAAMWAMGRAMDDALINAALGTAYTGETGTGTQTLGTGNKVQAVSGAAASNLNVQALRKAKLILDQGNVDASIPRYCAINASGLENLLSETQVTSSDYNAVKSLVQGEVDTFMGFKFIRTEQLIQTPNAFKFNTGTGLYDAAGTDSVLANSKSCIAWAGDGLLLAVGEDMKAEIAPRPDKGFNTQVYVRMSVGATRLEEAKVVEIVCKQS